MTIERRLKLWDINKKEVIKINMLLYNYKKDIWYKRDEISFKTNKDRNDNVFIQNTILLEFFI